MNKQKQSSTTYKINQQYQPGFITKYGWVLCLFLLVLTISIQLVFWKVVPFFLDLYQTFGMEKPAILPYHYAMFIVTLLADAILFGLMIWLIFDTPARNVQKMLGLSLSLYGVLLMCLFIGGIVLLYVPIYNLGRVIG